MLPGELKRWDTETSEWASGSINNASTEWKPSHEYPLWLAPPSSSDHHTQWQTPDFQDCCRGRGLHSNDPSRFTPQTESWSSNHRVVFFFLLCFVHLKLIQGMFEPYIAHRWISWLNDSYCTPSEWSLIEPSGVGLGSCMYTETRTDGQKWLS